MFGWSIADAACASCTNRSFASASRVRSGDRNFSATKRFRRVSMAVDHTHAAAAQLLDDAIVRDGLTNHGDTELTPGDDPFNDESGIGPPL